MLINIMLGKPVNLWPEAKTDLDNNGTIDVSDLNIAINFLLGK